MKKYNKFKLIKDNKSFTMIPSSNITDNSIKKTRELIDSNTIKETFEFEPYTVSSEVYKLDDKEYIKDKICTGKVIYNDMYNYRELIDSKKITTRFMGIYDRKEDASNNKLSFITKEEHIKEALTNNGDIYDYKASIREINIPNNIITVYADNSLEASKKAVNILDDNSSITNITEEYDISYKSELSNGSSNTYDDALIKVNEFKDDSDNVDISFEINKVRNNKLDSIEITEEVIDDKNKAYAKAKDIDNEEETINYQIDCFKEDNEVSISPKKVYKEEDINKYIEELEKNNFIIIGKLVTPLYIRKRINEIYDNYEDAINRKKELDNLYKDYEFKVNKEEDISKNINNSIIDDIEFDKYEEALKYKETKEKENRIVNIIEVSRLELITKDKEIFKSREEALERAHILSTKDNNSIPIHYALTKIDDYYYSLSLAYYGYKKYYQIEIINIDKGYIYRVTGEIPCVNSYAIEVEAKRPITKYLLNKKVVKKGYNYEYKVSYKKKVYNKSYKINSVTPLYQLCIKGKGTINSYKQYSETKKREEPIFTYKTSVNNIPNITNKHVKTI